MKKRNMAWVLLSIFLLVLVSCARKKSPAAPVPPPGPVPTQAPICTSMKYFGNYLSGTSPVIADGYILGSRFNLTQYLLIYYLEVYVNLPSGPVRAAIYRDSSGAVGALVAQSGSISSSTGWTRADITPTYLAAGDYWLVFQLADDSFGTGTGANYSPGASGSGIGMAFSYGNFPASFSPSYNTNSWSIRAVGCQVSAYTPTSTWTPTVTTTPTQTNTGTILTSTSTATFTPTSTRTVTSTPVANCAYLPLADVTGNINGSPVVGNTTGHSLKFSACNGAGLSAPDDLYAFSLATTQVFTASLCGGATFDTVLYLRTDCASSTCLASSDDYCSTQSQFTVTLGPGNYYLIVDGYGSYYGAYSMTLSALPLGAPTYTPTAIATRTPTYTPTISYTATNTYTPTISYTATNTYTQTNTRTPTPTITGTFPTDTATFTETPTHTKTPTPSPTATGTLPTATLTWTYTPAPPPPCPTNVFGWNYPGSGDSGFPGVIFWGEFPLGERSVLQGVHFDSSANPDGGNVRVAVYGRSGLIAESSPMVTLAGWNYFPLPNIVLNPDTYVLAYQIEPIVGTPPWGYATITTPENTLRAGYSPQPWGPFPANIGADAFTTTYIYFSIYGDVCPYLEPAPTATP